MNVAHKIMLSKRKGETVKAKFSFTFLRIDDASSRKGSKYYIQWKRGKKKNNQGKTNVFTISEDGTAKIDQTISFECTLLKHKEKYEEKYISIAIKDV